MCSPKQETTTHRGGAVLWFLRKHAPMPTNSSDFDSQSACSREEAAKTPLAKGSSLVSGTIKATVAAKGKQPPTDAVCQREFLHRTLMAIGVELDEGRSMAMENEIGGRLPFEVQQRSARQREALRRRYATHTDNQFEQLRKSVADREADVAALRQKLQQLQRHVEATRDALVRRRSRLVGSRVQEGTESGFSSATASSFAVASFARKRMLKKAGTKIWDADGSGPGKGKFDDTFDEMQRNFSAAMEKEREIQTHVQEEMKILDQQTIRRKAAEAVLFSTHADILRVRAQALQKEARVTRLANELRRVYKHLPRVVQLRLDRSAESRMENTQRELSGLQDEHRQHYFKFMGCVELSDESRSLEASSQEMEIHKVQATSALKDGRALVASSFQDAWTRLYDMMARTESRKFMALVGPDEPLGFEEEVRALLHQAELEVKSIEELLALMLDTAPTDGESATNEDASSASGSHSTSRPVSRAASKLYALPSSRPGSRPPSSRPESRRS